MQIAPDGMTVINGDQINVEDVKDRLEMLGYVASIDDDEHIAFELTNVINYVKNYCNISEIPPILNLRIIDRVCAYFLYYKKNSGSLDGFNYDAVIKQIKEGDTSITYAVGQGEDTPENRFDAFVRQLERGFDKWITPYRRLRW